MRDDIITYVNALFIVYILIILVRILLSWVRIAPARRVTRALFDFVHQTTDWFLNIFRRIIPPLGPVDLSPIVAILVLYVLQALVVGLLESF